MSAEDAQIEAARRAKGKARKLFEKHAKVTGVGLTRRSGVYHVKVNLAEEPRREADLPKSIDGIPVVLHVTGRIRKQSRSRR
jgi:hypothetical protein